MRILFLFTISLSLALLSHAQQDARNDSSSNIIPAKRIGSENKVAKKDAIFQKRKAGYVVRREARTIPGELIKEQSSKCDSIGVFY